MQTNLKQWMAFAQAATAREEWPEALKRWRAVANAYPEAMPVEAISNLATAERKCKDTAGAEATLKKGLKRFPKNRRLLVEWANLKSNQANWDAALATWARVAEMPGGMTAHNYGGYLAALRKAGKLELFESLYSEAATKFPEANPILLQRAQFLMEKDSLDEAISILDRLIDTNDDAMQQRVYAYHRMKCLTRKRHANLPTEKEIMSRWSSKIKEPVVSVICIAYNHEKFIADALDGFLVQKTSFPFEIIVHDDVSTDGTQDILRGYQSRYPNLIRLVLQEENAFSRGIKGLVYCHKLAKGKYIAACEGDDFWFLEDKLEMQVKLLDSRPDLFMCYHEVARLSEIYSRSAPCHLTQGKERPLTVHEGADVILLKNELPRLAAKMYRNIPNAFEWVQGKVLAGDQVHASASGFLGKVCRIGNYHGSVWRINNESTWTPLTDQLRNIHIFGFRAWLAIAYLRAGEREYGLHYYNHVKNRVDAIEDMVRGLEPKLVNYYIKSAVEAAAILKEESFRQLMESN